MDWKSFFRQLIICSGLWSIYFMEGMCFGFPTVLIPQLRKANHTVTIQQSSWLASFHTYCGIPWAIILSILLVVIGRKKSHITVCIITSIGFIIFYFSTSVNHFFIGQFFHGPLSAAYMTTCIAIMTECVSPEYRGIFLTIKSATFFWGIFAANVIGTFFHWQNIALLGLVCTVYSLVSVIIWPESPLWLATKGRFEECSEAHRWLKGTGREAEKELNKLIKSHENKIVKQEWTLRYLFKKVYSKQFLKPVLLSNLVVCLYCFSGKVVSTVYAIDILKGITNDKSTAYTGMLILDGVTVASMYLGCILSKFLKRRVMLIGFSIVGIIIMVCIAIYLRLAASSVIKENKYVSILLLAGYSISISCGPMIMSTSIIGELLPLDSRILSMCAIALTFKVTYGTFAKISPYCFKYLGLDGTFGLYAVLSTIFLVLIYYYVPETKDKSLHEIHDCLIGKTHLTVEERNELVKENRSV